MNLLAAVRSAPIRYTTAPASMNDHWRKYHIAKGDCNCNKCTGNSNPYAERSHDAFSSSPREDIDESTLTELMELAWKEYEEEVAEEAADQTQKIWKKRERSRRKATKIEENPELTDSMSTQQTAYEANTASKLARARRIKNTKHHQKCRKALMMAKFYKVPYITLVVEEEPEPSWVKVEAPALRYKMEIPWHLAPWAGDCVAVWARRKELTGRFRIIRMTSIQPWQMPRLSPKRKSANYDPIRTDKNRRAEMRFQAVSAAHDQA